MEKAVGEIFASARTTKASKIYLHQQNKCSAYLAAPIYYVVCEQTFSLINFNKKYNIPLLLMGI